MALNKKSLFCLWLLLTLSEMVLFTAIMFEVWRVDVVELRERNKGIAFCEFLFLLALSAIGLCQYFFIQNSSLTVTQPA